MPPAQIYSSRALLPFIQRHWMAIAALAALWMLVFTAVNDNTFGDNRLNALTAQSIIERQSLDLAPYIEQHGLDSVIGPDRGTLRYKDDARYNFFPLGTPLSMIPFVATAKYGFGADMVVRAHVITTRKWYCAFVLSALFLLLYATARLYFPSVMAATLALTAMLGSTASSTMALGAWSHDTATLCVAVLIWAAASRQAKGRLPISPWLLGFILFYAYLARPSSIPWTAAGLAWLLWVDWRAALKAGLTCAASFGGFVAVSYAVYGQWLPFYYQPGRVGSNPEFWNAIAGNLLSPARGLFVFSPFLAMAMLAGFFRKLRAQRLVGLVMIGFLLQLYLISGFEHWWGGWSFGPRLQTEALPGLFALSVAVLHQIWYSLERVAAKWLTGAVTFLLLAWGILVHTVQGAYMPRAIAWNGTIDLFHEDYIWEWEFPQFWAGFQPHRLAVVHSAYKQELKGMLRDVPEGAAYFFPPLDGQRKYVRRLTRTFNSRGTFGNREIFNEWAKRPAGKPVYTNAQGRRILLAEVQGLRFVPAKNYRDLGTLLEDNLERTNFVVANCVDPNTLSPFTRDVLTSYCADWLAGHKRVALIMVIRDRSVRIEKTVEGGKVEHLWWHKDFKMDMAAFANNCESPPRIRYNDRPQANPSSNAFFCALDEASGALSVQAIDLNQVDTEAPAIFRLEE